MTTKIHQRTLLFVVFLFALIIQKNQASPLLTYQDLHIHMNMINQLISRLAKDTVSGFGHLVLCDGSYGGREHFVHALKRKMCGVDGDFIWKFATKLCEEKGPLLDEWVSQTFDGNGDGIISNFEKEVPELDDD